MNITKTNKGVDCPKLRGSLNSMRYPAIAEIKFDGEYNEIQYFYGKIEAINKYGTVKADFPALNTLKEIIQESKIFHEATLICEIYADEGKSGDLYTFLKQKNTDKLNIRVFDITSYNNKDISKTSLINRKHMLQSMGMHEHTGYIIVHSEDEAMKHFNTVTDAGYEGIVVKPLDSQFITGTCSWVKIKTKDHNEYRVIRIDNNRERIEVLVITVNKERPVGVKATNRYKQYINLGDMVTIEHQGILASGSLRSPVLIPRKEWV